MTGAPAELILPGEAESIPAPAPVSVPGEKSREEFLAERMTGLGGSDMAAVVGLNPYRSAWDVWAEHRGLVPPFEGNERTLWGQLLEEPIAHEYAKRRGVKLRRVRATWRDPERPYFIGHPDRLIVGEQRGLEVKTFDGRKVERWSRPGEPIVIPEEHYVQVQWYQALRGFPLWDLATLFGVRELRVYSIEAADTVIAALREAGERFWKMNVLAGEPPPMEPTQAAREFIARRWMAPDGAIIPSPSAAADEWVYALRRTTEARKKLEKEEEALKAHVQGVIGDHLGIEGAGYRAIWTVVPPKLERVTDWEAVARESGVPVPSPLVEKHTQLTTTRAGYRRLHLSIAEEK